MLKREQVISLLELNHLGWHYVCTYDSYYVMAKESARMMWCSRTHRIILLFTEDERYASW